MTLPGNADRGQQHFLRLCAACHTKGGLGFRVGPDLGRLAAKPPEVVLSDILEPNRIVPPEYAAYEFTLAAGESIVEIFASESATGVTIRRPGAADANVPRAFIRNLSPLGKSLMPEGFEVELDPAATADLWKFLQRTSGKNK